MVRFEEAELKWSECQKLLNEAIRIALHVPQIQLSYRLNTTLRPSALLNTSFKLIEVTPKVYKDGSLVPDTDWFTKDSEVEKVSAVMEETINVNGFRYIGVEKEASGSPVFVVEMEG